MCDFTKPEEILVSLLLVQNTYSTYTLRFCTPEFLPHNLNNKQAFLTHDINEEVESKTKSASPLSF